MQLFLRTVEGETRALSLRAGDGVEELWQEAQHHQSRRSSRRPRISRTRLVFGGFQLDAAKGALADMGITNGSTVHEVPCLPGGGGDGGTTAQQRKYMRQAHVAEKATIHDETEKQRAKFHMCAASGHPLGERGIVACELGFVYNKEAVLKQIALKTLHPTLKHLRKLKDLFDLKPTENPDYDASEGITNILQAKNEYRFVCPVTGRPANGKNSFVAIKKCGCMLCEQALREIKGTACPNCTTPFDRSSDVVLLNPPDNIVQEKRELLIAARAEAKAKAEADGSGKKRIKEVDPEVLAKKAKLESLAGAGTKVGAVINKTLTNTINKSAKDGSEAHVAKAKEDEVYASMFKKHNKEGNQKYDAFWGQGAMAGVLGGR